MRLWSNTWENYPQTVLGTLSCVCVTCSLQCCNIPWPEINTFVSSILNIKIYCPSKLMGLIVSAWVLSLYISCKFTILFLIPLPFLPLFFLVLAFQWWFIAYHLWNWNLGEFLTMCIYNNVSYVLTSSFISKLCSLSSLRVGLYFWRSLWMDQVHSIFYIFWTWTNYQQQKWALSWSWAYFISYFKLK